MPYVELALLINVGEVEVAMVLISGLGRLFLVLLLGLPRCPAPSSPSATPPCPSACRAVLVRFCSQKNPTFNSTIMLKRYLKSCAKNIIPVLYIFFLLYSYDLKQFLYFKLIIF
jgi:hypothetical protein